MAKKRGNNEGSIVKRKDGRWQAALTVGRDPQTGRLKRVYFYGKTRKDVDEKLTKAKHETAQGVFVAPHKLTVGEWLDTWLWEYKRPELRPTTFDSYEAIVRKHLKPAFGHIALGDLRPEHIQPFYNGLSRSAGTIALIHTVLHAALKRAEQHQLVVRNVSELTVRPRREKKEMNTLSPKQIVGQLLPAIQNDRLYAAIFLAFGTGLRRGELLGLRWQDVDLDKGILRVRQTLIRTRIPDAPSQKKTQLLFQEPKTSYSRRTVPIPAQCVSALRQHRARQNEERLLLGQAYQDHDLVFCKKEGQPLDPRSFLDHFYRMLKQAGLPHIRFHDARHSFATAMMELDENPKTVQMILGHSRVAVTLDIYSHVSLELEQRAAARLDAVFKEKSTKI